MQGKHTNMGMQSNINMRHEGRNDRREAKEKENEKEVLFDNYSDGRLTCGHVHVYPFLFFAFSCHCYRRLLKGTPRRWTLNTWGSLRPVALIYRSPDHCPCHPPTSAAGRNTANYRRIPSLCARLPAPVWLWKVDGCDCSFIFRLTLPTNTTLDC